MPTPGPRLLSQLEAMITDLQRTSEVESSLLTGHTLLTTHRCTTSVSLGITRDANVGGVHTRLPNTFSLRPEHTCDLPLRRRPSGCIPQMKRHPFRGCCRGHPGSWPCSEEQRVQPAVSKENPAHPSHSCLRSPETGHAKHLSSEMDLLPRRAMCG